MAVTASPLSMRRDPSLLKVDGLIGGTWIGAKQHFSVKEPATGSPLVEVENLDPRLALEAVAATKATDRTSVCVNGFYVQDRGYETFAEKLAKVEAHSQDATILDAVLVCVGERSYAPTVLADVSADMLCEREEIFDPMAPAPRFQIEGEAIDIVKTAELGLGCKGSRPGPLNYVDLTCLCMASIAS